MSMEKAKTIWDKIAGEAPDDERLKKLHELAKLSGVQDRDTMFILLTLLQAHFHAFDGRCKELEKEESRIRFFFQENVRKATDALGSSVENMLEKCQKRNWKLCGIGLLACLIAVAGAGLTGYKMGAVNRPPLEATPNKLQDGVRLCLAKGGGKVAIAEGGRLACFPAEGDAYWLE